MMPFNLQSTLKMSGNGTHFRNSNIVSRVSDGSNHGYRYFKLHNNISRSLSLPILKGEHMEHMYKELVMFRC